MNHIMDMADFFKKNEDICATDVTSKYFFICSYTFNRW